MWVSPTPAVVQTLLPVFGDVLVEVPPRRADLHRNPPLPTSVSTWFPVSVFLFVVPCFLLSPSLSVSVWVCMWVCADKGEGGGLTTPRRYEVSVECPCGSENPQEGYQDLLRRMERGGGRSPSVPKGCAWRV